MMDFIFTFGILLILAIILLAIGVMIRELINAPLIEDYEDYENDNF